MATVRLDTGYGRKGQVRTNTVAPIGNPRSYPSRDRPGLCTSFCCRKPTPARRALRHPDLRSRGGCSKTANCVEVKLRELTGAPIVQDIVSRSAGTGLNQFQLLGGSRAYCTSSRKPTPHWVCGARAKTVMTL